MSKVIPSLVLGKVIFGKGEILRRENSVIIIFFLLFLKKCLNPKY